VQHPDDSALLSQLTTSLNPEGEQALAALAATAVALNTPTANPETIGHALVQHTTTVQNLSTQLAHVQSLQGYMTRQQALLRAQLTALKTYPAFKTPANIQRQTTEHTRQTKHTRTRIRECEDRLAALQANQSRAMTPGSKHVGSAEAIGEMLQQQKALDELRERVEAVEREVDEYEELPADREMARKEVGRLEVRLDEVRRRRDELFEGLVGK
jgi:HAUS augmin-like complex subunit 1